jgi:hypothetical protein
MSEYLKLVNPKCPLVPKVVCGTMLGSEDETGKC